MDQIKCEKWDGTGHGERMIDDGINWETCFPCHGSGKRPLTFADLRECCRVWYVKAGGDMPTPQLILAIDQWLKACYGTGEN